MIDLGGKAIIFALLAMFCVVACGGRPSAESIPPKPDAPPPVLSLCQPGTIAPGVIRIGVPESIVGRSKATPGTDPLVEMAAYLSERIGTPLEFVPLSDYLSFSDGLVSGDLHGALIPPVEYLRTRKRMPCLILVATTVYGTTTSYDTNLIVRRDSDIRVVGDLAGKRIAFSSSRSASGYVYAAKFLADHGLKPYVNYEPVFTGGHRETIRAVQQRTVDAGATFAYALRISNENGNDMSNLGILAVAGHIPSEPLVLSPDLTPTIARRISLAFLDLDRSTSDERAIMDMQELLSGWVPTDEKAYEAVSRMIDEVEALGSPEGAR